MSKSRKKMSTLSDLDPVVVDKKEAEEVKGGRKAAAGQQEYIKMEFETVIIQNEPTTVTDGGGVVR